MKGTAYIEADDEQEAEELAEDALRDFTTYNFEEFEVEDVQVSVDGEADED